MKGLMIKDFQLLKRQGIVILLFAAVFAVLQLGAGNRVMGVAYTTLLLSTFSVTTISYDEYENGLPFLFTLPILRRDYVREKFLFSFLVTTAVWAVMCICVFLVFDVFGKAAVGGGAVLESFSVFAVFLLLSYLMTALELAFQLRFGQHGRMIAVITVTVVTTMAMTYFIIDYAEGGISLQFADARTGVLAVGAALLVLAAVIFLLYQWTVRVVEKREL